MDLTLAKYKIQWYQVALLINMEYIITKIRGEQLLFLRDKIEEKKSNLKIDKFNLLNNQAEKATIKTSSFLEKVKVKIHNLNDEIQSMNKDCVSHKETPELFCEPYIHTGFRPTNKPYTYYIKSLFTKHNETINAWSHYLGSIYTLSLVYQYDFSDPYSWPILTAVITSTIMFFTSASAHLLHQKSQHCHMTCFLCDYAGISFNGFGAALMQVYVSSPIWYFKALEPYLLPFIGFLSSICCILNCIAQTKYKRPYPPIKRVLQFVPCGLLWLFTQLPLLVQFFYPDADKQFQINYAQHLITILLFIIGAVFFAFDFPQRCFPGKFDFFGQGHHLFHVCVFIVVMLQLNASYSDYLLNKHLIAASRQAPTITFCFLSLIIITTYYIYIIYSFYKMIAHNFDKNGNFDKNKKEIE